jgi:phage recombination protein Bet
MQIVKYKAENGREVQLTPETVLGYIVSGDGSPSPKEVVAFMAMCQARKLDPLAGDAYMVSYKSSRGAKTSVIVSKDYYLQTACRQPDFDGFEAGVVVAHHGGVLERRTGSLVSANQARETLVGGWAKVYSKNRSHPSEAVVSLAEYSTGRSMWKPAGQGGKPATMIRKVALVQALREMYPAQFVGLYDKAEMGDAPDRPAPQEVPVQAVETVPEPPRDARPPVDEAVPVEAYEGACEPDEEQEAQEAVIVEEGRF